MAAARNWLLSQLTLKVVRCRGMASAPIGRLNFSLSMGFSRGEAVVGRCGAIPDAHCRATHDVPASSRQPCERLYHDKFCARVESENAFWICRSDIRPS